MRTLPQIVLLVLLGVMLGCNGERKQNASDAIAGIDAVRAGVVTLESIYDPIVKLVAASADAKVEDLPTPQINPSQLADKLDAYVEIADEAEASAGNSFWAEAALWATGAVAAAIGIVKSLGVGGPLVNIASVLFESRQTRASKTKQKEVANLGLLAIEIIEVLDNKQMKEAIAAQAPPEQQSIIKAKLAEMAAQQVLSKA